MTEADRIWARGYAREEAEQAGLDEDQVDAVVDMAVGNYWDPNGAFDVDHFEDLVAGVIQGIAMP